MKQFSPAASSVRHISRASAGDAGDAAAPGLEQPRRGGATEGDVVQADLVHRLGRSILLEKGLGDDEVKEMSGHHLPAFTVNV